MDSCDELAFDKYVAADAMVHNIFWFGLFLTFVPLFFGSMKGANVKGYIRMCLALGIVKVICAFLIALLKPTCPAQCTWCFPSSGNTYYFYTFWLMGFGIYYILKARNMDALLQQHEQQPVDAVEAAKDDTEAGLFAPAR